MARRCFCCLLLKRPCCAIASPLLLVQTSRAPPLLRATLAQGSGGGGRDACCVLWLFGGWISPWISPLPCFFGSWRAVCLFGCVWALGHVHFALPGAAVLGGLCEIFMMARRAYLIYVQATKGCAKLLSPTLPPPLALITPPTLLGPLPLTRPTHPPHHTSTERKTVSPARGRDPWSEEFAWPSGVREPTSSPPPLLSLLQQPEQKQATTTTLKHLSGRDQTRVFVLFVFRTV